MPARRRRVGRATRFEIKEPSRLDKDFGLRHARGAQLLRRFGGGRRLQEMAMKSRLLARLRSRLRPQ
jgi:hypothetical protein